MRWQSLLLVCALQQAYAVPMLELCLQSQDIFFICEADEKHPCIPRSWICDGAKDCESGSDETFCNGCDPGWFRCEIGHPCVENDLVCDGTKDCPDGSDESVSRCAECPEGKFICDSDECISNSSVCDGVRDCFDNSDELPPHCFRPTKSPCNLTVEFNCLVPPPSSAHCIPKYWVCDGEEDCYSGIDEGAACATGVSTTTVSVKTEAAIVVQCADDEFQCYDGVRCLQWSRRCDKIVDCHDDSDETDCADVPHCPPKVQFSCTNKNCIPWARYCNGVDECGDNSDEFNCHRIRPTWHGCEGMFHCNNSKCIPMKRVCDDKDHCGDGSDEPDSCSVNECLSNDTCPGSQQCLDLPTHHICVCPHGFQITETGCEDINECQQYGHCSQYCTNTQGSFSCSCADGYTLKSDYVTCQANDGNAQLIYAHGQDVRMMNLLTGAYSDLAKNRLSVVAVDYNFKEGMVYFGEYQRHRIVKVPANSSYMPVTILNAFSGAREPDGLAIDWINDWVYWSSPHFRTISMAKLDGSYHRVVVNESLKLDEPRGVAVDPLKGYLFWTDWGDHSHIGRASMDGSAQQHIITNDVVWPNGIAVDTITQYVYWVDGNLGTVVVADYYGRNKKVLIQGGIGRPLFIALFEDKMYVSSEWGPHNTGRVFIASRMDGSHMMTLEKDVHSVQGVAIYQSKQQRPGPNPCDGSLCSDQCVASYTSCTGYKCICQDDTQLLNDEFTCENKVTRCSDSYCNNNGQCVIKDGSKSCLCDIRHQGSKCEAVISGVLGCPHSCCHHHGQCHLHSIKGPYCVCSNGYTGIRCEVEIYNVPSTETINVTVETTGTMRTMRTTRTMGTTETTQTTLTTGFIGTMGFTGTVNKSANKGHISQQNSGGKSVGVAVGGAIAGLLVITGVIIFVIFNIRKKKCVKAVALDNPMYTSYPNDDVIILTRAETTPDNHSTENSGFPPP